jgi:AraC-like DNA-binding protein
MEENKDKRLPVDFDSKFPFFVADSIGIEKISSRLHKHDAIEVDHIVEGTGIYLINGQSYPFAKGDIFIINKHDVHMAYNDVDVIMQVMMFAESLICPDIKNGCWLDILKVYWYFGGDRTNKVDGSQEFLKELIGQLEYIKREYAGKTPYYQQAVISGLIKFATLLGRGNSIESWSDFRDMVRDRERLIPLLNYIESNLDKKLTLEVMATYANMSIPNFSRVFKSAIRKTPVEYINHLRILKAAELLTDTNMSVLDVAGECGFFTMSNFINAFKRYTHKAPLQFRNEKNP